MAYPSTTSPDVADASAAPREVAQRWGWLAHGLPEVERTECRRLLVRATMAGESEKIIGEAISDFRALRGRLQDNGDWHWLVSYYLQGPGPETRKRATESGQGCRDLLETSMDEDPFDGASEEWSHLSADDFGTFSELMSSPSPAEEPPAPRAKCGNQKPTSNKMVEGTDLPPNVTDLNQWGRTLIQFGKYKTSGMTYEELALADTKEMNSYKVWVVAHLGQTTGQCQDLGRFLRAYTDAGMIKKPAVIPGTNFVRQYGPSKSSSSSSRRGGPSTPKRQ